MSSPGLLCEWAISGEEEEEKKWGGCFHATHSSEGHQLTMHRARKWNSMEQSDLTASDEMEEEKLGAKQRFCLSHLSSVAKSRGLSSWLCVPEI